MESVTVTVDVSEHDPADVVRVVVDDVPDAVMTVGSATALELESAPLWHGLHVVSAIALDQWENVGSAAVGEIFVNTGPSVPGSLRVASQAPGGPITFAFVESRELREV